MRIKYKFFPLEKLFVYRVYGEFSINKWKNYYHTIMLRKEWECIENVLVDLRETSNLIDIINDIPEMKTFRIDIIKKNYKTVLLADNPDRTVFTHLYVNELLQDYPCSYCSTIKYALEVFEIDLIVQEFEKMIYNLDELYCN